MNIGFQANGRPRRRITISEGYSKEKYMGEKTGLFKIKRAIDLYSLDSVGQAFIRADFDFRSKLRPLWTIRPYHRLLIRSLRVSELGHLRHKV
jgi:hypothetical protein